MQDNLTVAATEHGPWTLLNLSGELDSSTEELLRSRITTLVSLGRLNVAVNLESLRFTDSTGLAVFVDSHRKIEQQGGRFALVSPQGIVAKVLRVTGLDDHFEIHSSVESLPLIVGEDGSHNRSQAHPEYWVG